MLKNMNIKGKMSNHRPYPLLSLMTFFLLAFCFRAEAMEVDSGLSKLASASCGGGDCAADLRQDRFQRNDEVSGRSVCCPGPKGRQGPQGPQGFPACPGTFTDFASYLLTLIPGQTPVTLTAGESIAFQRQVLIRGNSITAFPPFSSITLAPGSYEITVGVSTADVANQVNLRFSSAFGTGNSFVFPAAPATGDFITYNKIIQVFIPTQVSLSTVNAITFTPPAPTSEVPIPGIAAYMNILRLQ